MINSINAYKHMENFDEVMQQIAVQAENKHGTIYYELKIQRRVKNIDIRTHKDRPPSTYLLKQPIEGYEYRPRGYIAYNSRPLITPLGRFESFKLAAAAHNLSEQALRNRLKRDTKGEYRYETDI